MNRSKTFFIGIFIIGLCLAVGCVMKTGVRRDSSPESYRTQRPVVVFADSSDYMMSIEAAPTEAILGVPVIDRRTTARFGAFISPANQPLSTFSIDVDTAAWSSLRRSLLHDKLPGGWGTRVEEMVNYFPYHYAPPTNGDPLAVHVESAASPWNENARLFRIGIKGRELQEGNRPPMNLVFLVDVSGSMHGKEKLPLVRESLEALVWQLGEHDRVSMVRFTGKGKTVATSIEGNNKEALLEALNQLRGIGGTNTRTGLEMAYDVAGQQSFKGAVSRVILCTDGQDNAGRYCMPVNRDFIQEKAKGGVYLSVLAFGGDEVWDYQLEQLADNGNGNYAWIDSIEEAKKVFVRELESTLIPVAKDVKLQVEFNPGQVTAYRLIGYDNRRMGDTGFNDDALDAGDLGAGEEVTALYEVIPANASVPGYDVDALRYQVPVLLTEAGKSSEFFTLKARYKEPESMNSKRWSATFTDEGGAFDAASPDFRFATAVTTFGLLLKDNYYNDNLRFDTVLAYANGTTAEDKENYRSEFLSLVKKAQLLANKAAEERAKKNQ